MNDRFIELITEGALEAMTTPIVCRHNDTVTLTSGAGVITRCRVCGETLVAQTHEEIEYERLLEENAALRARIAQLEESIEALQGRFDKGDL